MKPVLGRSADLSIFQGQFSLLTNHFSIFNWKQRGGIRSVCRIMRSASCRSTLPTFPRLPYLPARIALKCKLSDRFESERDTISGETFSSTMSNRPAAFGCECRFRNSGYRALAHGGFSVSVVFGGDVVSLSFPGSSTRVLESTHINSVMKLRTTCCAIRSSR
jgi:hypothetical protein